MIQLFYRFNICFCFAGWCHNLVVYEQLQCSETVQLQGKLSKAKLSRQSVADSCDGRGLIDAHPITHLYGEWPGFFRHGDDYAFSNE